MQGKIIFKKALLSLMLANQLAMATETEVVLNAGALSINDIGNVSADNITLSINGGNLRIVNTVAGMTVSGPGVVEIDPNTAEVPIANITTTVTLNDTEQLTTDVIDLTGVNLTGNGVNGLSVNGSLNASVVTFNNLNSSVNLNDNAINCQSLTLSTSGGSIFTNAATTLACNNLILNAAGDVNVQGMINSQTLSINASASGDVILSNPQNFIDNISSISSGRFNITADVIGTIGNLVAAAASNLENSITTNSATAFNGAINIAGTSDLLIEATGGEITQTGNIDADQLRIDSQASNIILNGFNSINSLSTPISLDGNLSINDSNGLDLAGVNVTGDLTINAGAAVTDSAANTVVGLTTINVTGADFTLDESGSDFSGGLNLTGANVVVLNLTDLTLGNIDLSGSFTINVTGGVTQLNNSVINVASQFSVTANNDIILNSENNAVGGFVNAAGVNINWTENSEIILHAISASGSLTVTSVNSQIFQNPTQTIEAGQSNFTAAAGYDVTLTSNVNNLFSGAINVTGHNVSINNTFGLLLGTIQANALNVVSSGSVDGVSNLIVDTTMTIQGQDYVDISASGNQWNLSDINAINGYIRIINESTGMTFNNLMANGGAGNISLGANGNIDQTNNSISANKLTLNASGNVSINHPNNMISQLEAGGGLGHLTLSNQNSIEILDVNVNRITLNQISSAVNVSGNLLLTGGSGNSRLETSNDLNGMGQINLDGSTLEISASNADLSFMSINSLNNGQLDLFVTGQTTAGPNLNLETIEVNGGVFNTNSDVINVSTLMNLNTNAALVGGGGVNGPVMVNSGGMISPGFNPTEQLITTGNLFVADGGTLQMEIQGINPGLDHDQVTASGTVTLDATADLGLVNGIELQNSDEIMLVNNDGSDAVLGEFLNKPESNIMSSGLLTGQLTYQGGDGNDISIKGDLLPAYEGVALSGPHIDSCINDINLTADLTQIGLNYYLLNSSNEVIFGPQIGIGLPAGFTIPAMSSSDSYSLFAAKPSQSLAFDGMDDTVEVSHDASFNFSDGLTIDAWIYANDITTGNQDIWRKEGTDAIGRTLLSFQDNGTVLSFGTETTVDGYTELDVAINPADYTGQWVHVMAQFDDANDTMKIFRNGVEIGQKASLGTQVNSANPQAGYIGSWNGNAEFFDGDISSLRIWNKAVTDPDEKTMIQSNLITADAPGLIANYPFIENIGVWLTDVSNNDNKGSILGASWNGSSMGGVGAAVSNIHGITCVSDLIFYDGFD